jgi:serine/threonine-protein kinase
MYQIMNATPAAPSTLNPAVPGMANFIVAKALSKKLEDRYQNARDLATDLRACRDTLPRSGKPIDVTPPGGERKLPDAIDVSGSLNQVEEEAKPAVSLSPAFDSAAATMRLAALTGSSEDVDELSKTLKIARPDLTSINRAKPPVKAVPPAAPRRAAPAAPPTEVPGQPGGGSSNAVLIALIVLMLLGIAAILMA